MILRTTALSNCEYEWGVHVSIFASKVGLTKQQVQDTLSPEINKQLWSSQEILLLNIVDELKRNSTLSGETKDKFQSEFKVEAQLEIYALCGFYMTVAFTANNSEIGLESFAATFNEYQ